MGQIKRILSYMFKHFWRLILPIVPSAIILGLFYKQAFSLTFITEYSITPITGFSDVFGIIFSGEWWYYVLIVPVMLIAVVASGSYLVSMVYKHFRTGKISVRTPFVNMNHSFGAVLINAIIVFALILLYKFIFACILSLISMIPAATAVPSTAEITLAVIVGIVSYFPIIYMMMYFVLTVPVMLVYGYSFNEALSFALKLRAQPKFFQVELAYMFPLVINALVAYVMALLGAPEYVSLPVQILCNGLTLSYTVVFAITVVFDLLQIERMDTKKLY